MFASPASTTLTELVKLRLLAETVLRTRLRKSAAIKSGEAASRRLGRGLDFAEVREYIAGDDVRNIDWNVTARTGKAHTKLFVEERESPVMLVVDFRSSMRFGTQGMYKSMMAARLSALLGWCHVANGDRVGGMVFTDQWRKEIRPESGRRGLMKFLQAIEDGQRHVPEPGVGQFGDCLSRLRTLIQAGTSVYILSDFADFDRRGKNALLGLIHRHDFNAIHIVDPIERQLPKQGRFTFKNMFDRASDYLTLNLGGKHQLEDYRARQAQHERSIESFFSGSRSQVNLVSTNDELLATGRRVLHGELPQPETDATENSL